MKRNFVFLTFALFAGGSCYSQAPSDVINTNEVERVERTLSSDDMQGRRVFTPGIEKAANFIASEFKAAGLQPFNNAPGYLQNFSMLRPKFISATGTIDGNMIDEKNIIAFTTK